MQPLHDLLAPFVRQPLQASQLKQLQDYLDLLLKWNARMNLTAIRDPEEIVRRHFGESLFAGEKLAGEKLGLANTLIDFGSGAGFPGVPIKIAAPHIRLTLIESQHKKATFLREVVRTLGLQDVTVYSGRAETSSLKAQLVTMRAVEKYEGALPIAAELLEGGGRLGLLIGAVQVEAARLVLPELQWEEPVAIPGARERVVLIGMS